MMMPMPTEKDRTPPCKCQDEKIRKELMAGLEMPQTDFICPACGRRHVIPYTAEQKAAWRTELQRRMKLVEAGKDWRVV